MLCAAHHNSFVISEQTGTAVYIRRYRKTIIFDSTKLNLLTVRPFPPYPSTVIYLHNLYQLTLDIFLNMFTHIYSLFHFITLKVLPWWNEHNIHWGTAGCRMTDRSEDNYATMMETKKKKKRVVVHKDILLHISASHPRSAVWMLATPGYS